MKNIRSTILGLALLLTVAVTYASTLWEGSLTTVNNTTAYTPTNSVGTLNLQGGSYVVSDGGVGLGSNILILEQLSLDGSNFCTVASWTTNTSQGWNSNANIAVSWPVGTLAPTLYQRFQVTTVGSVGVGILQP